MLIGITRILGSGNDFPGGTLDISDVSSNGNYIAFSSWSSTLVPGDTNSQRDIFLFDLLAGSVERINVTGLTQADGNSWIPSVSSDGRFIAFQSLATNLVPGDTNGRWDVFIHDRVNDTISRASLASGGGQLTTDAVAADISDNGRFVTFSSGGNLHLHDRAAGATQVLAGTGSGQSPAISGDGRFVAFQSTAVGLVPNDTNNTNDVFVRDRQTGVTERVSVGSAGAQGNGASAAASISADGRYVAFNSSASNLVDNDLNGQTDIFVHDRQTNLTERVSVGPNGLVDRL